MKKFYLYLIATFLLASMPALATTSTIDPNQPSQYSALTSEVVRDNFLAAYNDINNLWTTVNPFSPYTSGLVPSPNGVGATYYLNATGLWTIPAGSTGGVPGGSSGQIQYNNSGSFAGFTLNGDCSANTSSGAITCIKTNSVLFAPSATTDATNASNISSGVLSAARLGSSFTSNQVLMAPSAGGALTPTTVTAGSNVTLTNTAGTLTINAATGSGSPGGSNGQIQYNNNGSFGGVTAVAQANGGTACTTPFCYYGLPNWQQAIQNVKHATGNAIFCTVGDSVTWAYLAGVQNSWPNLLGGNTTHPGIFTTDYGIRASSDSAMGDGSNNVANSNYGNGDSRISLGSGWAQDTSTLVLGNFSISATGTTGNFAITPSDQVDTFVLFYVVDTGRGILNANLDGGSNTQYNTAGTASVGKQMITAGSVGNHTLNLNWQSGGKVTIIGYYAYNSTQKQIIVVNAGSSGELSTQAVINTKPYNPGNAAIFQSIGCNLTAYKLGINDIDNGTSAPTYTANTQSIMTAAATSGDVILVTPPPSNPANNISGSTNAQQAAYYYNLNTLAQTNNVPIVDDFQSWQNYPIANALQLYADTFVHPTVLGQFISAKYFARAVLGIPTQSQAEFVQQAALGQLSIGTSTPGIYVNASGAVGIGSTNPSGTLGMLDASAVVSIGTKVTTTGCSISATSGGATAGTFTLGANNCSAVIKINGSPGLTAPNGWLCSAWDQTAPTILIGGNSSSTATTATFTIPAAAGATDVIGFLCHGN